MQSGQLYFLASLPNFLAVSTLAPGLLFKYCLRCSGSLKCNCFAVYQYCLWEHTHDDTDQFLVFDWIARSCQVNLLSTGLGSLEADTNPSLKVKPIINFSCTQMFFIAFVLCILRLLKLKTEGQTIFRKPYCKVTKLKWN